MLPDEGDLLENDCMLRFNLKLNKIYWLNHLFYFFFKITVSPTMDRLCQMVHYREKKDCVWTMPSLKRVCH